MYLDYSYVDNFSLSEFFSFQSKNLLELTKFYQNAQQVNYKFKVSSI